MLCKHSDETGPAGAVDQAFPTLYGSGWVLLWNDRSHPMDLKLICVWGALQVPKNIPQFMFSQVHAASEHSNECHKPRGCVTASVCEKGPSDSLQNCTSDLN